MATKKSDQSVHHNNPYVSQKRNIKPSQIITAISLVLVVIFFIWWAGSDSWPWPSKAAIDKRLDEVIDTCMDNETSRACQDIKKKYNMTFKYCQKGYDPLSVYGVAWEGTSSTPPERTTGTGSTTFQNTLSKYINCKDHI